MEVVTKDAGAYELVWVLSDDHGVSTSVYEYGGGAYEVLPAQKNTESDSYGHQFIIFSDASDGNAVKVLNTDTGAVRTVIGNKPWLRYSEFSACRTSRWVLAIEEDHSNPEPKDVKNYVVAFDVESGKIGRLVVGSDFYSSPRYSPDGKWASWRSWDHPDMPWQNSALHVAQVLVDSDETGPFLGTVSTVAGNKLGQAIGESAWGLDGRLYWTQEAEGRDWRQLRRLRPEAIGQVNMVEGLKLQGLEEVEIGDCSMLMGW